jgi:hypothetical protein
MMRSRASKAHAITKLADKDGVVRPERVVEAAREPSHLLHDDFDWNDASAAHEHRLDTARRLIREVRVVVEIDERPATAIYYVHDPRSPVGGGYVALTQAAQRRADARQIIENELVRLEAGIDRGRQVAHMLDLSREFEALLSDVLAIRERLDRGKRPPPPGSGRRKPPGDRPSGKAV